MVVDKVGSRFLQVQEKSLVLFGLVASILGASDAAFAQLEGPQNDQEAKIVALEIERTILELDFLSTGAGSCFGLVGKKARCECYEKKIANYCDSTEAGFVRLCSIYKKFAAHDECK